MSITKILEMNPMSRYGLKDLVRTFKVSTVIEKLKSNRETHRAQFLKACEGYQKTMEHWLASHLDQVRAGKTPDLHFGHLRPVDMTSSYDTVIGMLEHSVEEEIELDQAQFRAYMEDTWEWSNAVSSTHLSYLGG